MSRNWPALLILAIPFSAPAAPVPKASLALFEPFGKPVEIRGTTCAVIRPGEIRVRLTKDAATESKAHDFARPNVARTVEGDFELTVRIAHTPPDAGAVTVEDKGETIAAAGIALVRADGKRGSLVVLNRLSRSEVGWDTYFKLSALYETKAARGSIGGLSSHHAFANAPLYLRLTRRGDVFTSTTSDDGKTWSPVFEEPHTIPGLGAVSLGPVAVHNTNGLYEVTFDEYTLSQPAKEQK